MKRFIYLPLLFTLGFNAFCADQGAVSNRSYILGPDDGISVNVVDLAELDAKTVGIVRVDHQGNIRLPLAGRIEASGLTIEGLEKEIANQLSNMMNNPEVAVAVVEYRDHPVSVLGSVRSPGVYQVTGTKTLFEVLSLAGGLNPDASNRIKITRPAAAGPLPLPNASYDQSHTYSTAELNIRSVMEAKNPQDNVVVLAGDVITVPKAEMVYIIGSVHKSGGFPLSEREEISVLQAVSMAEGLDKVANAKKAKILRQSTTGGERTEVEVNVEKILAGKAKDVSLQANDILFVPNSMAKSASMRALEAAIQTGTGLAIWGPK